MSSHIASITMSHDKTKVVGGIEWNIPYMLVWVALLTLTLVEVLIPEMSGEKSLAGISLSRSIGVFLLISLAAVKTYFVAWFYMHLTDERPLIVLIACAPFILSLIHI